MFLLKSNSSFMRLAVYTVCNAPTKIFILTNWTFAGFKSKLFRLLLRWPDHCEIYTTELMAEKKNFIDTYVSNPMNLPMTSFEEQSHYEKHLQPLKSHQNSQGLHKKHHSCVPGYSKACFLVVSRYTSLNINVHKLNTTNKDPFWKVLVALLKANQRERLPKSTSNPWAIWPIQLHLR